MPTLPNNTTQDVVTYKANIDEVATVHDQVAGAFYVHEAATPDMTVLIDAGTIQSGITLTSVSQQTTSTITAPTTNPRIDRIVVDNVTGVYSIIAGTEAASPVAPAVTAGKIAVAQIALATSTTAIANSLITDERPCYSYTPTLLTKVIEIGDWDMDATANIGIAHGLTYSKIRSVSVLVRRDDDTGAFDLCSDAALVGSNDGSMNISSTVITLTRKTSGLFDSLAFDSTSYNRGWITVQYVA